MAFVDKSKKNYIQDAMKKKAVSIGDANKAYNQGLRVYNLGDKKNDSTITNRSRVSYTKATDKAGIRQNRYTASISPLENNRYSWDAKKDVSEFNSAEYAAYLRTVGGSDEDWENFSNAIQTPGNQFYDQYWKGHSTQSPEIRSFFESFLGRTDFDFDDDFIKEFRVYEQYAPRGISGTVTKPTKKDSPEVWAGYYITQLLSDMDNDNKAKEQWDSLRSNCTNYFNEFQKVNGRAPSLDEFMNSINISDYSILEKMNLSRSYSMEDSVAPVQLNKGCNYSNESIVGLYNVLRNGGDISEDRSYFEDAVQYYMQPLEEEKAQKNGLSLVVSNPDYWMNNLGALADGAYNNRNAMMYDTANHIQYFKTEHANNVDDADYLGEKYGYYYDDDFMTKIYTDFSPTWKYMGWDTATGNTPKAPNSKSSYLEKAAWQAWQIYKKKEKTDELQRDVDDIFNQISSEDKADFASEEEFVEYAHSIVDGMDESSAFSKYRNGEIGLDDVARTFFIDNSDIDEYARRVWNGKEKSVDSSPDIPVVEAKADEVPPGYIEEQSAKAANDAESRWEERDTIADALAGLAESGSNISMSQIQSAGIPIATSSIAANPTFLDVLTGGWYQKMLPRYQKILGDNPTFEQCLSIDPALKMLASGSSATKVKDYVTPNEVADIINTQTLDSMSGEGLSVADGAVSALVSDPRGFSNAINNINTNPENGFAPLLNDGFNIEDYNRLYKLAKNSGFDSGTASELAVKAAIAFGGSKDMLTLGVSDQEIEGAADSVLETVKSSETYPDAAKIVMPIVEEALPSAGEATDETSVDGAEAAKEFGSTLLIGMSDAATPALKASTSDLINDIESGDITKEDIISGLSNTRAARMRRYADMNLEAIKNGEVDNTFFGMDTFAYRNVNGKSTPVLNKDYMEKLRTTNPESASYLEGKYNTNLDQIDAESDFMASVNNAIKKYGGETSNGKLNKMGSTHETNHMVNWLENLVDPFNLISDDANDERTKLSSTLSNYSNFFSPTEAMALTELWSNGTLTYDGVMSVVDDRLSSMSIYTANYLKQTSKQNSGVAEADTFFADNRSANDAYNSVVESGYSPELNAKAKKARETLDMGVGTPWMAAKNSGLADEAGLTEDSTDEEIIAVIDKYNSDAVNAENALNGESAYSNDQLDLLETAWNAVKELGSFGFDFVTSATKKDWKNYLGIDFDAAELDKSPLEYIDEITNKSWRNAYGNEGIGFVGTTETGLSLGFYGVGDILPGIHHLINDALGSIFGYSTKGDWYSRVKESESDTRKKLALKAAPFESFMSQAVGEFVRNRLTGGVGAAMANAMAGSAAEQMTKVLTSAADANISAMSAAPTAFKFMKAISAESIVSHLPFAANVFTGSYAENREKNMSVISSFCRAIIDTTIEMATETPEIESVNSKAYEFLTKGINNMSDGFLGYCTRMGGEIFNEMSQEEMSLFAGKFFDSGTQAGNFFGNFVKNVFSADTAQEALSTAASTAMTTFLGCILELPDQCFSKAMLKNYYRNNAKLNEMQLTELANIACAEMDRFYETFFNPRGVVARKSHSNSNMSMDEAKNEANQSMNFGSFDEASTEVVSMGEEKAEKKTGTQKATEVYKQAIKGEITGDEITTKVEEALSDTENTDKKAGKNEETSQDEESIEETTVDEKSEATTASVSNEGYSEQEVPSAQDDPTLSTGAKKVAKYMDDAEEQRNATVAQAAAEKKKQEIIENDPGIKTAEENVDAARRKLDDASKEVMEHQDASDVATQQMNIGLAAFASEGVNTETDPRVANLVASKTQEIQALKNKIAEAVKKQEQAQRDVDDAGKKLEEAKDTAKQMAESEGTKTQNDVSMKLKEAHDTLTDRSGKMDADQLSKVGKYEYSGADAKYHEMASDEWKSGRRLIEGEDQGKADKEGAYNAEEARKSEPDYPDVFGHSVPRELSNGFDAFTVYKRTVYPGKEMMAEDYKESTPASNTSDRYERQDMSSEFEDNKSSRSKSEQENILYDLESDTPEAFRALKLVAESDPPTREFVRVNQKLYKKISGFIGKLENGKGFFGNLVKKTNKTEDLEWFSDPNNPMETAEDIRQKASSDYIALESMGYIIMSENDNEVALRLKDDPHSPEYEEANRKYLEANKVCLDIAKKMDALRSVNIGSSEKSEKSEQLSKLMTEFTNARNEADKLKMVVDHYERKDSKELPRFFVYNKNDVSGLVSGMNTNLVVSDILNTVQSDNLEQYSKEHLEEILIEISLEDGMDDSTKEAIRKNIKELSIDELKSQIVEAWNDADRTNIGAKAFGNVQRLEFATSGEVRKHMNEGENYTPYDLKSVYLIHPYVLALYNIFNRANKSDKDSAVTHSALEGIAKGSKDFGDFIDKLETEASSITQKSSTKLNDTRYYLTGKSWMGELKCNNRCKNEALHDDAGNFIAQRGFKEFEKALDDVVTSIEEKRYSPYRVIVYTLTDKGRVGCEVGKYYKDKEGIYAPTLSEVYQKGNEVLVQHRSQYGRGYKDLDFMLTIGDMKNMDTLQNEVNSAKESFMSVTNGNGTNEQFSQYAKTYLEARAKILNAEISRMIAQYNSVGFSGSAYQIIKMAEEVKAKKRQLSEIRNALYNVNKLNVKLGELDNAQDTLTKEDVQEAVDDVIAKMSPESPEAIAAVKLAESIQDTSEETDTRAEQDRQITEDMEAAKDMSPEQKVAFFAEKAEEAKVEDDAYRANAYNAEIDKAVGYDQKSENTDVAEEKSTDVSDEEMSTATSGEEKTEATTTSETTEALSDENHPDNGEETLQQIFENYEPDDEANSAIAEKMPTQVPETDKVEKTAPEVDETTSVEGMDIDEESIAYANDVIGKQDAIIKKLNEDIEGYAALERQELENGAQRFFDDKNRLEEIQKELKSLGKPPSKVTVGYERYRSLAHEYNELSRKHNEDSAGREAAQRWREFNDNKKALIAKRNTAKASQKNNTQFVYGSETAAGIMEGRMKISPDAVVLGSKDGKTARQFAKSLLKKMKSGKFGAYLHGNRTTLTVKNVAEMIGSELSQQFYDEQAKVAKIITKHRHALERSIADAEFAAAFLNADGDKEKIEDAKDELIKKYKASVTRKDYSKKGFLDFNSKNSEAKMDALGRAADIIASYEGISPAHRNEEFRAKLNEISENESLLANMKTSEKMYYQLGNGDIEGCLNGDYGGQLPRPLMNIVAAMFDEAEISGGLNVSLNFDSPESVFDQIGGEYAPILRAIYTERASQKSNEAKMFVEKWSKDFKKAIPNKKIDVTVRKDGKIETTKMKISEVIGHIVDEKRKYEKETGTERRWEDYITARLVDYGITDQKTGKIIRDAVELWNRYTNEAYEMQNSSLILNGHTQKDKLIDYRTGYMPHYNNDNEDPLLAIFGIHTNTDEVNATVADESHLYSPSHEYNQATNERNGDNTLYDILEAFRRTSSSVANTIYMTSSVDRTKQLTDLFLDREMRDENGNIQRDEKTNKALIQNAVLGHDENGNPIYGKRFNQYVKIGNFLFYYAQRLANKRTSGFDRAFMKIAGRKGYGYLKLATSLKSAASVAFNVPSALTNAAVLKFLNGYCGIDEISSAFAQTVSQLMKNGEPDYVAANSTYLKGRNAYTLEERSISSGVLNAGYVPAELVDQFATNVLLRASFEHELNQNGGDKEQALAQAEAWVRRVQTDKSKVGRSQFYDSALLGGVIGQFQQEAVNESRYMLKDMKYFGNGGGVPKALVMALGVFLFNGLFNFLRGSGSMPDPIGETVKALNGFDENSTLGKKAYDVGSAIASSLVPLGESAMVSTGEDILDQMKGIITGDESIGELFKTMAGCFVPGYAQASRTYKGIKDVSRGYSETSNGKLKYETGDPTIAKYLAAAVFGTNALTEAKPYVYKFDGGMTAEDTKAYKGLRDAGFDASTAYSMIANAKNVSSAESNADFVSKVEGSTYEEKKEAEDKAKEARTEQGIPSDVATWAYEDVQKGDSLSNIGIELYKEYGVETYPKEITTTSKTVKNGKNKTKYRTYEGTLYEMSDDDYSALNNQYKLRYNALIRKYTRGEYGEVGSKNAAKALESALTKEKNNIWKKYAQSNKVNKEVDENGEE